MTGIHDKFQTITDHWGGRKRQQNHEEHRDYKQNATTAAKHMVSK